MDFWSRQKSAPKLEEPGVSRLEDYLGAILRGDWRSEWRGLALEAREYRANILHATHPERGQRI